MNRAARLYVFLTLGLTVALAGGVGLLNCLVDPYNFFGNNRLGVYISAERESKAREVRRYPHNALLVGNSRMAMIPVDHVEGFRFFNGAFSGATAEEVCYFVEHFATKQDLVILGVDPGQHDPPALKGDIFVPPGLKAGLENALNLKTAEYSIRTIFDHWAGKPASMTANGSFDAANWFKLYDRENPDYLKWQLDGLQRSYADYTAPTRSQMTFYSRIAELLRQREIPCVVFIPPLHETVARLLQTAPAAGEYAAWRRELDAIFPVVVDCSLGADNAAENFFKSDPMHFKPEIGVKILNTEVIPVALRIARKTK